MVGLRGAGGGGGSTVTMTDEAATAARSATELPMTVCGSEPVERGQLTGSVRSPSGIRGDGSDGANGMTEQSTPAHSHWSCMHTPYILNEGVGGEEIWRCGQDRRAEK